MRVAGRLRVHDYLDPCALESEARDRYRRRNIDVLRKVLDRVPREGDLVRYRNLELKVEKTRGLRVASVLLELADGGDEAPDLGGAPHA